MPRANNVRRSNRRKRGNGRRARSAGSDRVVRAIQALTLATANCSTPRRMDIQIPRGPRLRPICTFQRSYTAGVLTGTNAYNSGAITFTLSGLPDYADFTNLFDNYRILFAKVKFNPLSAAFGPISTTGLTPVVYTALDYDDAGALTAGQLQEYDTCMSVSFPTYFERSLTPHAALAAYSGTFTSYSQAPQSQWFDCASPGILYYGVKWGVNQVTGTATVYDLYSMDVELTLQFRDSR